MLFYGTLSSLLINVSCSPHTIKEKYILMIGKIYIVLNSSLHESTVFKLVIILIYLFIFFNSEYFNTIRGVTLKKLCRSI